MPHHHRNLLWLTVYAIAMAQVEASVVVHLRTIYYPHNPLAIFPLALLSHRDLAIELIRELATLVMILSIALLSSRGFVSSFTAFVYVFGWWDLFYYVWLKLMIGWPQHWLEWDVLFLIPWPWFGPWTAAALIAVLFMIWGGWVIGTNTRIQFSRVNAWIFTVGVLLALTAFLLPAVPLLPHGEAAFQGFQPHGFLWSVYIPGFLLMVLGLWRVAQNAVFSPAH